MHIRHDPPNHVSANPLSQTTVLEADLSVPAASFSFFSFWFKQDFIEDEIKIQCMVMGSLTSLLLTGGELIYIIIVGDIYIYIYMADKQFHQANNK